MVLIKLGEALTINSSDLQSFENIASSPEITERFTKLAQELKIVAPKANDFLYFTAVMMHAAEASSLNEDGSLKSLASGEPVKVWWEKKGDSWKWASNDLSIKPYRNANLDIFPEEELLKAYKKWVGKPLCLDHKSSSVEMVRGLILDTYYDHKMKRVVALCALDKKNYPELARQVSTGYAASVSMGTGVEKAICSDCGTVAKAEPEFCSHMKFRTCYGEINTGLNPIELSIVVTGADPRAKIKHVIAAANSIARYVTAKEEQFEQNTENVQPEQDLQDWRKAYAKATEIKQEIAELESEASTSDLSGALNKISMTLVEIQKQINKLSNKDSEMSSKKAYFQGGGGVSEPAPGQVKYPKEDGDKVRDTQDKQMSGQMDTGPVDGMHPGYESFGESETDRKKRLQRLASEEVRALRRQAALEKAKQAYFQGGGGVAEPTPGKATYPKDDAESIRNKEDKQMSVKDVGKQDQLFPGDEAKKKMLSRAEKLNAKFVKAAKSDGSDDLGKSRWDVYADSKLVLSASVDELTGGRSELFYDKVATRDFGKSLLSKVLSNGVEKVASLVKGAQAVPMAAPQAVEPAPAEPAPMGGTGLLPAMPEDMGAEMADEGGTGDPSEKLPELLDEAENVLSDIRQGIEALSGDSGKELEPVAEMAQAGMASPALASLVNMQKKLGKVLLAGMREEADKLEMVIDEMKVARKALKFNSKTASVRKLASETVSSSKDLISKAYQLMDAFNKYAMGTEILVEKSKKEMKKSAQFAGNPLDPLGTDKKLEEGASAVAPKRPSPAPMKPAPKPAPKSPSGMSDKEHAERRFGPGATGTEGVDLAGIPKMVSERAMSTDSKTPRHQGQVQLSGGAPKSKEAPMGSDKYHEELAKMYGKDSSKADDKDMEDDKDMNDVKMNPDGSVEGSKDEVAAVAKELHSKASLATPEGRAAWRAKALEKVAKDNDSLAKLLQDAHKGGGTTLDMGFKPSGDLAKVETLEETHKAMKDIALASPKVKKAAEDIQKLVASGKIAASKVDDLVKAGLDKDAVNYWKQYFGQGKDSNSKEFATELTSEHAKAKVAAELGKERVKLARAYDLANEMARKGAISAERHAINQQVDELLSFNDEAFTSMQRYVDRMPAVTKQAFAVPQVGLIGEELISKQASDTSKNLVEELTLAFNSAKKHF